MLTENDPANRDGIDVNPDQWVDRYGDALYRYALAKTGSNTVAEDLVQETLLAGFKRKAAFRQKATVSTWLFSILKNKIADHYRANSRRPPPIPLDQNASEVSTDFRNPVNRNQDPADLAENADFQKVFENCVGRLPNKLAEVYALKEVNGHSLQEVREILGVSPTNLSMRLHRCRLALRDCLQTKWFQESD